jgi:hypothetical protein
MGNRPMPYHRPSLEELDKIIEELKPTRIAKSKWDLNYKTVAERHNVEAGLLMIRVTSMWDTVKEFYIKNTETELYKTWNEYKEK